MKPILSITYLAICLFSQMISAAAPQHYKLGVLLARFPDTIRDTPSCIAEYPLESKFLTGSSGTSILLEPKEINGEQPPGVEIENEIQITITGYIPRNSQSFVHTCRNTELHYRFTYSADSTYSCELRDVYTDTVVNNKKSEKEPKTFIFKGTIPKNNHIHELRCESLGIGGSDEAHSESNHAHDVDVIRIAGDYAGSDTDKVANTYSREDIEDMLFSPRGPYTETPEGDTAFGSMRDFYLENSYGKFDLTGKVYDWVMADEPKNYYDQTGESRSLQLAGEIMEKLVAQGVPQAELESYDGFALIYAGRGTSGALSSKTFTDEQFYVTQELDLDFQSKGIINTVTDTTDIEEMGVHAHEFAHSISRLRHQGAGNWSTLSTGFRGGDGNEIYGKTGRRPVHLSGWFKTHMSWLTPTLITDGSLNGLELSSLEELPPVGGPPLAYKILLPESYLLLTHRRQIGFDRGIGGEGMLIWHVDETQNAPLSIQAPPHGTGDTLGAKQVWPTEQDVNFEYCDSNNVCTLIKNIRKGFAQDTGYPIILFDAEVNRPTDEGSNTVYVSSSSGGTADGIRFKDEDIVAYDPDDDTWSLYFDGSNVGVLADVKGFLRLNDGSLLITFNTHLSVPGLGSVDDSDIVRFVPTSTGPNTAGAFSLFFDGSDVGLTKDAEDIDAIGATPDGRLVISTIGKFNAGGASGNDEDLFVFNPVSFGPNTAGTFEVYMDASDVGINGADVDAAWLDPANGDIYLSKSRPFDLPGASGDSSDIFVCTPGSIGPDTSCTFSVFWDGSDAGFARENTDGLSIGDGISIVIPGETGIEPGSAKR